MPPLRATVVALNAVAKQISSSSPTTSNSKSDPQSTTTASGEFNTDLDVASSVAPPQGGAAMQLPSGTTKISLMQGDPGAATGEAPAVAAAAAAAVLVLWNRLSASFANSRTVTDTASPRRATGTFIFSKTLLRLMWSTNTTVFAVAPNDVRCRLVGVDWRLLMAGDASSAADAAP